MGPCRDDFDRFLPPTPLARRLSVQSVLFAIGEGTFITGSAVFFTQIVGLSAGQVGIGITVAGLVSFALSVPLGKLADRFGPKRMWSLGAFAGRVALRPSWPLIDGFGAFVADDDRARGGRHGRLVRPRRVHDRRVPAGGARAVAGVHAGGAQHRLHGRRPGRRPRPGLRQRRHHPGRPALHRGGPHAQRALHHPAPRRGATTSRVVEEARRPRRSARARCATAASSR